METRKWDGLFQVALGLMLLGWGLSGRLIEDFDLATQATARPFGIAALGLVVLGIGVWTLARRARPEQEASAVKRNARITAIYYAIFVALGGLLVYAAAGAGEALGEGRSLLRLALGGLLAVFAAARLFAAVARARRA